MNFSSKCSILVLVLSCGIFLTPSFCRSQEPAENSLLDYQGPAFSLYLSDPGVEGAEKEGDLEFRVQPKGAATFEYFQLEHPDRVVIDVEGVKVDRGQLLDVEQNDWVRKVRIGVHSNKVRIVLDLKQSALFMLSATEEGGAKIFTVKPRTAQPPPVPVSVSKADPVPEMVSAPSPEPTPGFTPVASAKGPSDGAPDSLPPDTPTPAAPVKPASPVIRSASILTAPVSRPEEPKPAGKEADDTPAPAPEIPTIPEENEAAEAEAGKPSGVVQRPPESMAGMPAGRIAAVNVQGFEGYQKLEIPRDRLMELAKIDFSVDKVQVTFKAGDRPVHNIVVQNPGSRKIFLSAVPQRLERPGEPDEKRVDSRELLVSPRRFSIEPGSQRTVRLLLKEPAVLMERVYTIGFSVNKESFEAEFLTVQFDGKPVRLRVVANLGVLVLAEPENAKVLLGTQRSEKEILLTNRGTSSVRLTSGKVCRAKDGRCLPVNTRRLYPGNVWKFQIPPDWSLFFIKESVNGFEHLFLPPFQGT